MLRMLAAGGMPVLSNDSPRDDMATWSNMRRSQDSVSHRARDTSWLAAAEGKACEIPSGNLPDFPASHEYRIIFMLRDIEEVLAALETATESANNGETVPPEILRYHLERHLRRIRRLLDGPRQLATCYCEYEEMCQQPLLVVRQVASFLGLRLNTNAMAAVAANFAYRKRSSSADG